MAFAIFFVSVALVVILVLPIVALRRQAPRPPEHRAVQQTERPMPPLKTWLGQGRG